MTYVVPEELKQMLAESVADPGSGGLADVLARILERHQEIVRDQVLREVGHARPLAAPHEIRFFIHQASAGSPRPHYFGAECACSWSSGLNAVKWVLLGIQQHLEEHGLTWDVGNLLDSEQLERERDNARTRLAYAREALVKDGYFTEDEVDDDIAPRIGELCSHMRHQLDQQLPGALLEALDQLRVQVRALQAPDLVSVARFELERLWCDLDEAIRFAADGKWSIACINIVERIHALTEQVGPTPWENISPRLLTDGTYQKILGQIGISVEIPREHTDALRPAPAETAQQPQPTTTAGTSDD